MPDPAQTSVSRKEAYAKLFGHVLDKKGGIKLMLPQGAYDKYKTQEEALVDILRDAFLKSENIFNIVSTKLEKGGVDAQEIFELINGWQEKQMLKKINPDLSKQEQLRQKNLIKEEFGSGTLCHPDITFENFVEFAGIEQAKKTNGKQEKKQQPQPSPTLNSEKDKIALAEILARAFQEHKINLIFYEEDYFDKSKWNVVFSDIIQKFFEDNGEFFKKLVDGGADYKIDGVEVFKRIKAWQKELMINQIDPALSAKEQSYQKKLINRAFETSTLYQPGLPLASLLDLTEEELKLLDKPRTKEPVRGFTGAEYKLEEHRHRNGFFPAAAATPVPFLGQSEDYNPSQQNDLANMAANAVLAAVLGHAAYRLYKNMGNWRAQVRDEQKKAQKETSSIGCTIL